MADSEDIITRGREAARRFAHAAAMVRSAFSLLTPDERALLLGTIADELAAAEVKPRPRLRDVVISVLLKTAPLNAAAIYEAAAKEFDGIKKNSLDAEISTMKSEGLLAVISLNQDRGAAYYALADQPARALLNRPSDLEKIAADAAAAVISQAEGRPFEIVVDGQGGKALVPKSSRGDRQFFGSPKEPR